MQQQAIQYTFDADIWRHSGTAGWYFVSLPPDFSKEIRTTLKYQEQGWGRLKVSAKIGETQWQTAIWYDTKQTTYLLPLKAEIRKIAQITAGQTVTIGLWI
jgi:hypothetical protein